MNIATAESTINPGDTVIIEVINYRSGVSSIPHADFVDQMIGTLAILNETSYTVTDDNGHEIARIDGVYDVEPDTICGQDRLFIRGWVGGVWSAWLATN